MRFLAAGVSVAWDICRLRAWDIGIADSFITSQDNMIPLSRNVGIFYDIMHVCHRLYYFCDSQLKTTAMFSGDSDAVTSGRI